MPPTERRRVRYTFELLLILTTSMSVIDASVNQLQLLALYQRLAHADPEGLLIDVEEGRMLVLLISGAIAAGRISESAGRRAMWAIAQAEPL